MILALIASIVLLFLAISALAYVISLYNSLIQVKNNIRKAWSNIDVVLIERNQEIMKLVDLTRSYASFEKELLLSLTNLRTSYHSAERTEQKTKIENEISERVTALAAVWEKYPALQANDLFGRLQSKISELQSVIADRRIFFNETVKIYNDQQQRFPQLIFARMLGFKPHPYLKLPAGIARQ
jgi:LemA protein